MPAFPGTPSADVIYGSDSDDTITGQGGDDHLFGFGGNDTIDGGDGSDVIFGGTGADTMTGGTGDDYYEVDNVDDRVTELAGGGFDLVFTTINYILPDNVERLAAYDPNTTYDLTLIGNDLDNEIIGNKGANFFDGGAGQDIMRGNLGDDQYVVSLQGTISFSGSPDGSNQTGLGSTYLNSSAPDIVSEISNGGTDTIWVEFTGSTEVHNWFDYTLIKGAAGTTGEVERLGVYDRTTKYAVNLQGDLLNNQLFGNDGANILDGWLGGDLMVGYDGDDTYYVNTTDSFNGQVPDTVVERAGEGFDTVILTTYPGQSPFSGISSYQAPANVERIIAGARGGVGLTGNGLANVLIGNDESNFMNGGSGDQKVDVLQGGGGNDDYRLGTSPDGPDIIVEFAGGGRDQVLIDFANYTLPDNVEDLTGRGKLTGNDLNNVIRGAEGSDDVLDGRAGADTMTGLTGNDTYFVDAPGDVVVEQAGGGIDTVFASFNYTLGTELERLVAVAGTAPLALSGNGADNEITGNDGDNLIDGKYGEDVLQGLGGADTFAFTTSLAGSGADQILDFEVGIDRIALDDAIFTSLRPGALAAGAFTVGTSAQDADDRIVYDPTTGWLWYDRDGSGSATPIHFATVHEGTNVTAGDFVVI